MLPGLDGTGKLLAGFIEALGRHVEARIIEYPLGEPLGYDELELLVRAALPADRPFVLLGESFGGPLAIRIAAAPPDQLRGLVLCATFARTPYPLPRWAGSLASLVPVKGLPRWLRAPLMWGSAQADAAPAESDRATAPVSRAVMRRRLRALLEVDVRDCLGRITHPALILYGLGDRILPRSAANSLAAAVPNAELAPIEGPHLLLQSTPLECAAAVSRWLTSLTWQTSRRSQVRVW
jgi:pimeloyl-ACP methyl ester carboxylesterase